MQKLGTLLPVLLVLFFVLIPVPAEAANTSLIQIFPEECKCEGLAPDWGCVLETVRNLINTAIAFGAIVSVLIIAYAGALWMFSPFNPGNREKGRTLLLNAVIGLAIALGAWLIVDFVMKSLYNEEGAADNVQLGPWNSILSRGNEERCVQINEDAGNITSPDVADIITGGGLEGGEPGEAGECPVTSNGLCFQTQAIVQQYNMLSGPARTLATCMRGHLADNIGHISSIADSYIVNGTKTWAQCRAGECQHTGNSAHYGGQYCGDTSYALDYGDEGNSQAIISAANQCGAIVAAVHNGNHVHVTAPNNCCELSPGDNVENRRECR